ncbi:MAG: DUF938 domain-containing protein [Gammaproteobacteria bacterium]|nr:DUF938 domain-containing protein [Gammaproteobacteria bacterium]
MKPFAQSSEQNKEVILKIIEPLLSSCQSLLEIGSGTGQHAIYFSQAMPHLKWIPSDQAEALPGIQMWLDEYCVDGKLNNLQSPLILDVSQKDWPELSANALFTANTLHIMHWNEVKLLFQRMGEVLNQDAVVLIYGPFNYDGKYTSSSNEQFDGWLKSRDPKSGIRDFTKVNKLAKENGLSLISDFEMPENNRILFWRKN